MTRIVYLLLALNLGLLTWNLYTRSATGVVKSPTTSAPPMGDVNQLPLLAELDADALRERVAARRPEPAPPGDDNRVDPGTQQVAEPQNEAPRIAGSTPAPDVEPITNEEEAGAAPAGSSSSESVAGGVTEEAPTEAPDASVSDRQQTGSAASPALACLTIGPLDAQAPLDEISAWLEQSGATVDVRSDERREVALYWVYFPPRTSREAALAEVEKLRGEGVTDVIAVPKGDMSNAISLGVFSRPESRDRRVREMNKRGYQPSVAPRYRVKLATWIDVSAAADTLAEAAIRTRWPTLGVTTRPCEDEQIAAGPKPSYNAVPSTPRRFHFSGANAEQSSATASATQ